MKLQAEIARRRTFAIISHPDAGKTTLTEKFLLYAGAIQIAGAVRSNKIQRGATSDFMEIERQRGISVTTAVLTFDYQDVRINLLDTPGHRDFAEDTYRTLTAVDSVILVIDSVKGVEEQTEKLMRVCHMRKTPVIIFINKLDLEGRDPFDLLSECEQRLKMHVQPLSFPIGNGRRFQGVYNLFDRSLQLFTPDKQRVEQERFVFDNLHDDRLDAWIGATAAAELRQAVELIQGVYGEFPVGQYLDSSLALVFFGSARNNFGVRELLDTLIRIAPAPQPRPTDQRWVFPQEPQFYAFVFKVHSNIYPRHRNRIAFLRIVSGVFSRNQMYYHCRLGKYLRFTSPYSFLAATKNVVDNAYPGDVIGIPDTGTFRIGDTLSEGEPLHYRGFPHFSPEIFKEVVNRDPLKTKQLEKGITQLTEEGVAQLFRHPESGKKLLGTVGDLQFQVMQHRLEHEYGARCDFVPHDYYKACWITSDDSEALNQSIQVRAPQVFLDRDAQWVYLAPSAWMLNNLRETHPAISFHETSEFKTEPQTTGHR